MVLLPPVAGKNFPRQIWTTRRWPENDIQLHSDQPIPHLPAAISASLPRWVERKGHAGGDALRPCLRTSPGRLFSPGRSRSSPVLRVVCLSGPRLALLQWRLLGSHATAGHHVIDPILSGRSCPCPPASTESADQV